MTILAILHYPDERLHRIAEPVTQFNAELKRLVKDMIETMRENNGIGLAATQVNVIKRVFIIDLAKDGATSQLQVIINPKITPLTPTIVKGDEGCLSVPGVYEAISRFEQIGLEYQDLDGKIQNMECEGLKAICIQHETDHLDGKVFVDYLSALKKNYIKKKMKKLFRE